MAAGKLAMFFSLVFMVKVQITSRGNWGQLITSAKSVNIILRGGSLTHCLTWPLLILYSKKIGSHI